MKKNYSKDEKHLTERERVFVLQMAQHGDATKAAMKLWPELSETAARVTANGLMRRPEIYNAIQWLRDHQKEEEDYVEKL